MPHREPGERNEDWDEGQYLRGCGPKHAARKERARLVSDNGDKRGCGFPEIIAAHRRVSWMRGLDEVARLRALGERSAARAALWRAAAVRVQQGIAALDALGGGQ